MTKRGRANHSGKPGGHWFKWLFVLAIPFSVLFVETWLNTETLKRDLKMAAVNNQLRRLRDANDAYSVKIATLEQLDRIEIAAPDLGLISPQPYQMKTIYYSDGTKPAATPERPFAIADASAGPADEWYTDVSALTQIDSGNDAWDSKEMNQPLARAPISHLRGAIAAACESFFGPSW